MVRLILLTLVVLGSGLTRKVISHQESGEWSCESNSEIQVQADFRPGVITLDGHADDWKDIDGFEFSLLPALDPDEDHEYKDGKLTVKALHDGNDIFLLLQVDGDHAYSKGDSTKCPSVALMFQIGDHAIIIWVAVKNKGALALTRLAKDMKLTLCTSPLEMAIP